jgi:hypothetical protein
MNNLAFVYRKVGNLDLSTDLHKECMLAREIARMQDIVDEGNDQEELVMVEVDSYTAKILGDKQGLVNANMKLEGGSSNAN